MDLNDKQINRIKQLAARAKDTSSPAESELALSMLASMMERHGLDQAEMAALTGDTTAVNEIVEWTYQVITTGGHVQHRVAALSTVIEALGARTFYTQQKGRGYHGTTIIHAFATADVIATLEVVIPLLVERMEKLGDQVSRQASRASRLAGGHHSAAGCGARRGFFRGFADGIAVRIVKSREEDNEAGSDGRALVLRDRGLKVDEYMETTYGSSIKVKKAGQYDRDAYFDGIEIGASFDLVGSE
jgi:hypothetical protein